MKILYDHQIFCAQRFGGISRQYYEVIRRISTKEEVSLFAGINSNEYGISSIPNLVGYVGGRRPQIRFTGRLCQLISDIGFRTYANCQKVDIYHPTYYNDYGKHGAKLVVTVYDMIHELYPQQFCNDPTLAKKRVLINKADRIIAISESTKRDIVNILGICPEKIDVVYLANGLDLSVNDEALVSEPYLLLVGHGSGYKNFINFLQAYYQSGFASDVRMVVFGGPDFSKEEFQKICDLGLSKNIIYYRGDDVMLANLYKYAKLFVYPSQYEGFGLPPLEAMHYGTPVLVSNTSSIPEVVGNAGMYFNPLSIEDMSEKLGMMLNDSELLRILGSKGLEREKNFSWDKCADGHVDTYRKVLM